MDPSNGMEADAQRTRDRVFAAIRARFIAGSFRPGEKIKTRPLAAALGTSATPVREALMQLVVAGALSHDRQRSICVPILSGAAFREIRDLRMMIEGDLAGRAAEVAASEQIAVLEQLALELASAREDALRNLPQGGLPFEALERFKAHAVRFHFTLYGIAGRPRSLAIVENLWLQTGPYMNFLVPDFLPRSRGVEWRGKLCEALRRRDGKLARQMVEADLDAALSYIATRLDKGIPRSRPAARAGARGSAAKAGARG